MSDDKFLIHPRAAMLKEINDLKSELSVVKKELEIATTAIVIMSEKQEFFRRTLLHYAELMTKYEEKSK